MKEQSQEPSAFSTRAATARGPIGYNSQLWTEIKRFRNDHPNEEHSGQWQQNSREWQYHHSGHFAQTDHQSYKDKSDGSESEWFSLVKQLQLQKQIIESATHLVKVLEEENQKLKTDLDIAMQLLEQSDKSYQECIDFYNNQIFHLNNTIKQLQARSLCSSTQNESEFGNLTQNIVAILQSQQTVLEGINVFYQDLRQMEEIIRQSQIQNNEQDKKQELQKIVLPNNQNIKRWFQSVQSVYQQMIFLIKGFEALVRGWQKHADELKLQVLQCVCFLQQFFSPNPQSPCSEQVNTHPLIGVIMPQIVSIFSAALQNKDQHVKELTLIVEELFLKIGNSSGNISV